MTSCATHGMCVAFKKSNINEGIRKKRNRREKKKEKRKQITEIPSVGYELK